MAIKSKDEKENLEKKVIKKAAKTPTKKTTTASAKKVKSVKASNTAKVKATKATKSATKTKTAKTTKLTTKAKTAKTTKSTAKAKATKEKATVKTVVKKSTSKTSVKKSPSKKSTVSTKKTSSKTVKTNNKKIIEQPIVEYYDLPYRYNDTIVKVLAQNPNTLFVYWDISDEDKDRMLKKYGNDLYENTKPILVVYNLTQNYSFEIEINDFANNWYIHVDDTKCKYRVELGRKKKNLYNATSIVTDFIPISESNILENPNDHVLLYKDNQKIYFKNVSNGKITEKTIKNNSVLKNIYKSFNISETNNTFDFNNPSSGMTSNVM